MLHSSGGLRTLSRLASPVREGESHIGMGPLHLMTSAFTDEGLFSVKSEGTPLRPRTTFVARIPALSLAIVANCVENEFHTQFVDLVDVCCRARGQGHMLWLVPSSSGFLLPFLPRIFVVGVRNAGGLCAILQDRSVKKKSSWVSKHTIRLDGDVLDSCRGRPSGVPGFLLIAPQTENVAVEVCSEGCNRSSIDRSISLFCHWLTFT